VQIASCDLTDRRMYVRFLSPDVQVMTPELLHNYRSPFDGRRGSDLPVISGGFLLSTSETGYGRYSLASWLRIQVRRNGQTVERGTVGRTHIGARITDEGRHRRPLGRNHDQAAVPDHCEVQGQRRSSAVIAAILSFKSGRTSISRRILCSECMTVVTSRPPKAAPTSSNE
jgi:hypothetical protein